MTAFEELVTEMKHMREELKYLTLLVMKNKLDPTWLTEEEAAEAIGLNTRTLREHVKSKKFPWNEIQYRNTNGRNFQYSRKCIMNFKNMTVRN